MDRGAWRATVHGVSKSQMWLSERHEKYIYMLFSHPILSDATPWTVAH